MNIVYKSFGYFKNLYNQLNPATLTGAIDIVVIEQEDGSFLASPFHVRFGKLGVLSAKEKLVKITVNDEHIPDLQMKLGNQGEAFFVQEMEKEEIPPPNMITSPIPSRPTTPTDDAQRHPEIKIETEEEHVKRKRRKKRKRRSILQVTSDECVESQRNSDEEEESPPTTNQVEVATTETSHLRDERESASGKDSDDQRLAGMRGFHSDCEITTNEEQASVGRSVAPFSDSEATLSPRTDVQWGWGELPASNEPGRDSDDSAPPNGENIVVHTTEETDGLYNTVLPIDDVNDDAVTLSNGTEAASSPPPCNKSNNVNGLYLDEVLNLNPSEANLYLKQQPSTVKANMNKEFSTNASLPHVRPASPATCSDIDSGTDCQTNEESTSQESLVEPSLPESRISLCGFISGTATVDEAKFREKEVSFDSFLQNSASILNDPNLVFMLGDRYMNWQSAAPALIALVVYKQPLTKEYVEHLVQSNQPAQSKGIVGWFWKKAKAPSSDAISNVDIEQGETRRHSLEKSYSNLPKKENLPSRARTSTEVCSGEAEEEIVEILQQEMTRSRSAQSLQGTNHNSHNQFVFTSTTTISGGKLMRKTTRLNSKQLESLGLQEGANKIIFSVTTQYQGTSRCQATIYRWKWSDKIVVSDIDGTITKSDVFGQILPVVGKDWTQSGVAKLYQNIGRNGYKFMYLSARAIGQASMTKDYLNWINQQGVSLPPGPLFLSPTSLMIAFRREVIEKRPEKFKIDCLRDIKALFPSHTNPFSAGFGNKASDVMAYTAAEIPPSRMFTINHKGELRQEELQMYRTSYMDLGEVVDSFFPPVEQEETPNYSDFSFWRNDQMLGNFQEFTCS